MCRGSVPGRYGVMAVKEESGGGRRSVSKPVMWSGRSLVLRRRRRCEAMLYLVWPVRVRRYRADDLSLDAS